MNKIISQFEFWLILFGLAAAPNWSWAVWGSVEESRMIVIGLVVAGLALLELVQSVIRLFPAVAASVVVSTSEQQRGGISFGFFKNPLNWIISAPLLLVVADWLKTVIMSSSAVIPAAFSPRESGEGIHFAAYRFFGFGAPWSQAVLPILLLLAWHFLLRDFFTVVIASPAVLGGAKQSDNRIERRASGSDVYRVNQIASPLPLARLGVAPRNDKTALLKFAFAWIILFATIGLIRRTWIPASAGMTMYFVLGSALALVLAALRLPLSARSKSYRFGRLIYVPLVALIIAIGFFIRFEIRAGLAAASASGGDFNSARRLNPYHPEYGLSWAEREIDNMDKADLTADITAAKQKVVEIIKALEGLSSSPGKSLRIARAYRGLGKFAQGAADKAEPYYLAALAAEPNNQDLLIEAARFYRLEKKDPDQALNLLDSHTSISSSALIIEKAFGLEAAGKNQEALAALGSFAATLAGAGSLEIQYQIGRLSYNDGHYQAGRDIFLSILKADPNYGDANYSLGVYWERMKNYEKARPYFNKALELNPGNEVVKKKIDAILNKR